MGCRGGARRGSAGGPSGPAAPGGGYGNVAGWAVIGTPWSELIDVALRPTSRRWAQIVGIWSHLACSELPASSITARQIALYETALRVARKKGIVSPMRHLVASAALFTLPGSHYDLVRLGAAAYGIAPLGFPIAGITQAMTLRARVVDVIAMRTVEDGSSFTTIRPTRIAVAGVGYADGIPRKAGGLAVRVGPDRFPIMDPIGMYSMQIEIGDAPVGIGDEVIVFGPGPEGGPTASEWAHRTCTDEREIVARVARHVTRTYRNGDRI
ncbi:alanine racemase [Phytohabitans kaempferiae]|uniref:Alanine racemase n=1 Tax=Phytohabitans kaempferiae TaxID=1620943 RepID=A0ABV6M924_9ACTN